MTISHPGRFNPVAKHALSFNKAATHRDRKKASKQGACKHKGQMFER